MPDPSKQARDAAGVPFGTQIHLLAESHPDEVALVFAPEDGAERSITWEELDLRSTQLAHRLLDRGLSQGDRLAIALRNSPEHLMSCFAGWKVGAVVIPMRWDLPEWERGRVLGTMAPRLVVDDTSSWLFEGSHSAPTEPLPEAVPPHAFGLCSSGSTGTPKVIVMRNPGRHLPGTGVSSIVESYGQPSEIQRILVPAPLYHVNGMTAARNLMAGKQILLMERFNAPRLLDLVESHAVTGFIGATPMLQRLAAVPGVAERDFSSLEWVQQGAAALPVWLGKLWCELVGPEHFFLSYGASEGHGQVACRGDEWLVRPGTLGRGIRGTEIKVLDPEGTELPPGEVGAIYLRTPTGPAAFYVGDDVPPMPTTPDGFVTVGDLGWLDDEGYLFLADRRVDMIVTGAVNVFPAEVEAALSEHPAVADVVVIGLSDPDWGRRVHAVIQPVEPERSPTAEEIIAFAKSRLASYKAPKTVEFVPALPRSDAMKLNRAALVAERETATASR